MARYTISSFRTLSDYRNKGIAGWFKTGSSNMNVRGDDDVITSNQALKLESTTAVVGLIRWFINCTDGNTYGFDHLGNIYKRTSSAVWSKVYTDADGAITGACEWSSVDGKKYLYWTTATKLHRKLLTPDTNWTTDVDTTLTSVASTSTLTVSGSVVNNSTVTIGAKTYKFKTTLSSSPTVPNEVLIGANAEASIDNLVLAITHGATEGTNYSTGTVASTEVTAVKATAATMTVTALTAGTNGNYFYTATSGNYLSFPGVRMTGGVSYSTWPKINLTSQTWHTMTVADGGLNICNGDKLAYVGFDDSYTNESVQLIPGTVSKSLIEYQGRYVLIGGGNNIDNSYLNTWTTTALSWIDKLRIPFSQINAMINSEMLLMHCGANKLYFANLVDKVPVLNMDGMCNPGGVCDQDGLALFGIYGGSLSGIYSYGRTKKNETYSYNLEYYIDADEIGAIINLGSNILVSYKKGTTYSVATIDTTTKATATYISPDLKSPYGRSQMANWATVELITDDIPTGCSIACYYKLKHETSWTQATIAENVLTATTGSNPVFRCNTLGKIFEFKIVLTPSGNTCPIVHEIFINL